MLKKFLDFCDGKKTYSGATIVFVATSAITLLPSYAPILGAIASVGAMITIIGTIHKGAKFSDQAGEILKIKDQLEGAKKFIQDGMRS
jgi:hypothetical protein